MALVGALTVHDVWLALTLVTAHIDVGVDVAQLVALCLFLVAWDRP